ncbi:MAG: type II secretion system F family protein [Candidatus Eremiobacteraeota bacterium]|nr:type II secretion system F family protein [Candidatus Eremiobacteraeota bacterium]
MPEFIYVAITETGERVSGEIETRDQKKAIERLQRRNLTILELETVQPKHWIWLLLQPVKGTVLALFIRQLAVMLKAGIPLAGALKSLQPQEGPVRFKKAMARLYHDITVGYSLSQAMMKAPEFFSPFIIGSTRIGEASGNLSETLDNCATHFEKEYTYANKLKSALIYPTVLLTSAGALVTFIFTFMIPKFVGLFLDLSMELPWATRWLVNTAQFFQTYGMVLFCTLIGPVSALSWLFLNWARTKEGRFRIEKIMLKIPWYGVQIKNRMLAQYFRSFGTLSESGVTLHTSLHLLSRSLDREILSRTALAQFESIRKGKRLTEAMNTYKLFPQMCLEMIHVGEETGQVGQMMWRMASFFDDEMTRGLDTISKLVEPIVLMLLGSVVAFILLAAFLPIYQLASSF